MESLRERDSYQVCNSACVCKPMCVHPCECALYIAFFCPTMDVHVCEHMWSMFVHVSAYMYIVIYVCACVTTGTGPLDAGRNSPTTKRTCVLAKDWHSIGKTH